MQEAQVPALPTPPEMVRNLSNSLLDKLPSMEAPSLTDSANDGSDVSADETSAKSTPNDADESPAEKPTDLAEKTTSSKNGRGKNGQVHVLSWQTSPAFVGMMQTDNKLCT